MSLALDDFVNVVVSEVFGVVELKMRDTLHVSVRVDSVIDSSILEHEGIKPSCIVEGHANIQLASVNKIMISVWDGKYSTRKE